MKSKSSYIILIGLIVFLLFSREQSESIIYTGKLTVETISFVIILFLTTFIFFYKKIHLKMKPLEIIAVLLLGSFALSLVFMYLVNFYNKNYYSKDKPILIENCEITKISQSRKSRGYYFKFKDTNHYIAGWSDDLKKIEKNTNQFVVTIHYKESFFNSYVIVERFITAR